MQGGSSYINTLSKYSNQPHYSYILNIRTMTKVIRPTKSFGLRSHPLRIDTSNVNNQSISQ